MTDETPKPPIPKAPKSEKGSADKAAEQTVVAAKAEKPPKKRWKERSWPSRLWLMFKWLFGLGVAAGVIGLVVATVLYISWTRDLPDVQTLQEYRPSEMSRVHAGDGKLVAEYAKEHRVFVPIDSIPKNLQHAFISSEDQRFYTHNGWDPIGLTRAALSAPGKMLRGERIGGTSTITQQVAKNFLVGDDYSIKRKVREIAIARRMEEALTKDEILELYLNENYFGPRTYGIAAASLNYFGKPMDQLSLGEQAYLALLVKGPGNYQLNDPVKRERALNRRDYVLGRMVEDGYITQEEADLAKEDRLEDIERLTGEEYLAAEYFNEEVRRKVFAMYGEDQLYSGGLSIRTTLDTQMQLAARRALRDGLEAFDKRHGYRGPLGNIDVSGDWLESLKAFEAPRDIEDWQLAVIIDASKSSAQLGLIEEVVSEDGLTTTWETRDGTLALADMKWARQDIAKSPDVGKEINAVTDVFKKGDVILVSRKPSQNGDGKAYVLQQVPEVNGGIIAMDAHTGRVLALVGGYSFAQNQFNRVTQAYRQPGSAFKPFVYAAALDNGYTPASQILDAPFVIEHQNLEACITDADIPPNMSEEERRAYLAQNPCLYKPENYSQQFYGMSTMRLGVEKSRNAMTVRLANDMGMAPIMDLGERLKIYDQVQPELAWSLGAGETTLLRLAPAYAAVVNGGKLVDPIMIDRVQDRSGKTIYQADERTCMECQQSSFDGGPPPMVPDNREEVMSPITAYQMTSMLEGTVQRGTGASLLSLGRPLAGKTGTTNDEKDAWFMGFSPDLVIGVYVGMDTPEPMNETGAKAALPIWKAFAAEVLEDQPKVPFRIPEGVLLAPVNAQTGEPSFIGAPGAILEAFRPGTEPSLNSTTSTIRVGGGLDSFIGGGNTGQGSGDGVLQEDPLTGELGGNPPQPQPTEPSEDVLDDGLY